MEETGWDFDRIAGLSEREVEILISVKQKKRHLAQPQAGPEQSEPLSDEEEKAIADAIEEARVSKAEQYRRG